MGAWVAELVDARDLKSLEAMPRTSSILVPGTTENGDGVRICLKAFLSSPFG
jgi:hypothetical protein